MRSFTDRFAGQRVAGVAALSRGPIEPLDEFLAQATPEILAMINQLE
jgi:hypothetical protein